MRWLEHGGRGKVSRGPKLIQWFWCECHAITVQIGYIFIILSMHAIASIDVSISFFLIPWKSLSRTEIEFYTNTIYFHICFMFISWSIYLLFLYILIILWLYIIWIYMINVIVFIPWERVKYFFLKIT